MNNRLIIFTRFPEPGTTKTRMIPALGEVGAADLQREMTEYTLETVRPLTGDELELEIRYAGGDEESMTAWLGGDLSYTPQGEGDLGQRMERAFMEGFKAGCRKVVIIGTDCPGLTPRHLNDAFEHLSDTNVVLGPTYDGGYYLIGAKQPHPNLFKEIHWSTSAVLEQTLNAAKAEKLHYRLMARLRDIDTEDDLILAKKECGFPRQLKTA